MLELLNMYTGLQDHGRILGSEISWRLLNIQKPPPGLQEAGERFWDYHCSFALFCSALNSDCAPLPQSGKPKAGRYPTEWQPFFFFCPNYWQKKDYAVSYFMSYEFLHTHTSFYIYLYQKLIICFLVWWRWACSFGVCLFLLAFVTT